MHSSGEEGDSTGRRWENTPKVWRWREEAGYFLSEVSRCWNNDKSLASAIFLVLWSNQQSPSLSWADAFGCLGLAGGGVGCCGWHGVLVFPARGVTEGPGTEDFWWRDGACSNENAVLNTALKAELLKFPPALWFPHCCINPHSSEKHGERLFICIVLLIYSIFNLGQVNTKCKATQKLATHRSKAGKRPALGKTPKKRKHGAGLKAEGLVCIEWITWERDREMVFKHLGGSCRDGRRNWYSCLLVSDGPKLQRRRYQAGSGKHFTSVSCWKFKLCSWRNREISISGGFHDSVGELT